MIIACGNYKLTPQECKHSKNTTEKVVEVMFNALKDYQT